MRATLIIVILSANFLWLYRGDVCAFYSPVLYADTGLDTILVNSFVLFNHKDCDSSKIAESLDWIADQRPSLIVSTDINVSHGLDWGQTLETSVFFCKGEATKFSTGLLKDKLGRLGFDTANVADKAYIDFHFMGFNYIPIVQCKMYQDIDYSDKIVIVGDMGDSNVSPVYNNDPANYQIPEINGVNSIFAPQLLALVLHSIIQKDLIKDAPFVVTFLCYVFLLFFIYVFFEITFRKKRKVVVQYFYIKGAQIILMLSVLLLIFVIGPYFNYVFDSDLFNYPIVIGVEIIFWLYVCWVHFGRKSGHRRLQTRQ